MASASIKATLVAALDSFDADFNTAPLGLTATRPFTVVDAFVICRATAGGNTVTLSKGNVANTIFTAIACAADGDVTRATADYNATNAAIAVGNVLNITGSSGNTRGTLYATIIPGAIS